jgi:hypothetical protein
MEYTISEAAVRAGVSESTIRAARTAGAFKSARQEATRGNRNPRWLIPAEELDAAGFVSAVAGPAQRTAGPIYIEQRLTLISEQVGKALQALSTQEEMLAALTEKLSVDARIHSQLLKSIEASAIDSLVCEQLTAVHREVGRLTERMESGGDELTTPACEHCDRRFPPDSSRPTLTGSRWRQFIGALRW